MLSKQSTKNTEKYVEHVKGRVLTVGDVMDAVECAEQIKIAESAGFKPSPPSGGGHGQTGRQGARTSQFYVRDDVDLARTLWRRVKDYVPRNLRDIKPVPYMNSVTKGDEYDAVGVNEHMRFYKYDVGQHILKHDDYRMSRYRYDKESGKYYYQMTFLTLLVYLNDEFQDGETCFWTKYATVGTKGHCRFLRDDEETKFVPPDLRIKPVMGMALINDHMVQHEGEAPQKGTKYILRTDIVHEREINLDFVPDKLRSKKGLKSGEYSYWTRHYEPSCLNYSE